MKQPNMPHIAKQRSLQWFFCFLLFLPLSMYAQYFEGEVKYDVNITASSDTVDTDELEDKLGKSQTFLFKGSNLRINYPSGDFKIFIHNAELQKSFLLTGNNELQIMNDQTKSHSFTFINSQTSALKFNGQVLQAATLKDSQDNVLTIYYSDEYPLDRVRWGENRSDDLLEYYSQIGAVPLIIERKTPQFLITLTARSVKNKKLSDNLFTKPTGSKEVIISN